MVDNSVSGIQADIQILTQKIGDFNGERPAGSPFVDGLRGAADDNKFLSGNDKKLNALEKLLQKILEYDRLILKRTAPEVSTAPQRRKSRGADLTTLPTHLHVTDRLLDLYTQAQRVTIVTTGSEKVAKIETESSNPDDLKIIESLQAELNRSQRLMEDAVRHSTKMDMELSKSKNEVKSLEDKLKVAEGKLKEADGKLKIYDDKVSSLEAAFAAKSQANTAQIDALKVSNSDLNQALAQVLYTPYTLYTLV